MKYTATLTFLTPCFSHGATDAPEIRSASIRGMLHHWFRVLGGSAERERRVFGGINFGKKSPFQNDSASKVVVRVRNDASADLVSKPTLPHKSGGNASHRNAFAPGHSFKLIVLDRLGGLSVDDAALFRDSLEAWLLMGTLGFRATRAAGSFSFESADCPVPGTPEEYEIKCRKLLDSRKAPMRVAVLGKDFDDAEKARNIVSDSLGGNGHDRGPDSLVKLHDPLGRIKPERKTSPLKYRIVRFGNFYRILATWDDREKVTGNRASDLRGVIDALAEHKPEPKEIGVLLRQSSLYTN